MFFHVRKITGANWWRMTVFAPAAAFIRSRHALPMPSIPKDLPTRGVPSRWVGICVNAPDDTISGRFYGPGEEEVGGIFERDGIAGAFGGRRGAE